MENGIDLNEIPGEKAAKGERIQGNFPKKNRSSPRRNNDFVDVEPIRNVQQFIDRFQKPRVHVPEIRKPPKDFRRDPFIPPFQPDNRPGVPGVGPKTAGALLSEFGSMEHMYDNLDAIKQLPIRGAKSLPEKLATHQEVAMLSILLATVAYDAPIDASPDLLQRRSAEVSSLQEICHIMGGRGDGLCARVAEASKRLS